MDDERSLGGLPNPGTWGSQDGGIGYVRKLRRVPKILGWINRVGGAERSRIRNAFSIESFFENERKNIFTLNQGGDRSQEKGCSE